MTPITHRDGLAVLGLLSSLACASCAAESTGGPDEGPDPVPVTPAVQISPRSMSVITGGVQQFSVTVDSSGHVVARTVAWGAQGGTIDQAGRFVAGAGAGPARVWATATGATPDTVSGQVVAAPPAAVATVTVALANTTLTTGQTTQAAATLRDAQGATLAGRAVAWSSSNTSVATVNASGVVTAMGAGTANVVATSETKSGSAGITIQAPPPPPTGSEPALIFADDFESGALTIWQDGVDAAKHRVVTSFAHGGTRALEVTVPAGGDGGWLTRFFMPGFDSVYVSLWVRYGTDWTGGSKLVSVRGSRIDNQWSGFGNAGRCPTGSDFFSGNVVTDGGMSATAPGFLRLYSYYPGMPPSGSNCWGDYGNGRGATYADAGSSTPVLSPRGVWHHVEYFFKLNAVGQSNAEQYVWVDGRRAGSWTGTSFRTTTDLRINSVQLNLSASAAQTQHLYIDDVRVLRGRPAGLP